MSTAIYIRVSTEQQEKGKDSQRKALKAYCKNHGITNVRWYVDTISGNTTNRPALDRLRKAIFNGEVETVIVWALDRLTRRGPRDGLELLSRWMKRGVRVVSITEQLDLNTDAGEMVASLLFSIAKMYRTKLSENTKRGLEAAKARGVRLGRGRVLFFNEVEWKAAKQQGLSKCRKPKLIEPLLLRGMSVSQVARELGISRQSIYEAKARVNVA